MAPGKHEPRFKSGLLLARRPSRRGLRGSVLRLRPLSLVTPIAASRCSIVVPAAGGGGWPGRPEQRRREDSLSAAATAAMCAAAMFAAASRGIATGGARVASTTVGSGACAGVGSAVGALPLNHDAMCARGWFCVSKRFGLDHGASGRAKAQHESAHGRGVEVGSGIKVQSMFPLPKLARRRKS